MQNNRSAILYRMVLPDHVCPFGLRAKALLEHACVAFEDRILGSREAVDSFKAKHGVVTTPLIFIDGEAIGGSRELETYLERQPR